MESETASAVTGWGVIGVLLAVVLYAALVILGELARGVNAQKDRRCRSCGSDRLVPLRDSSGQFPGEIACCACGFLNLGGPRTARNARSAGRGESRGG